jgi:hypothetical protein
VQAGNEQSSDWTGYGMDERLLDCMLRGYNAHTAAWLHHTKDEWHARRVIEMRRIAYTLLALGYKAVTYG